MPVWPIFMFRGECGGKPAAAPPRAPVRPAAPRLRQKWCGGKPKSRSQPKLRRGTSAFTVFLLLEMVVPPIGAHRGSQNAHYIRKAARGPPPRRHAA